MFDEESNQTNDFKEKNKENLISVISSNFSELSSHVDSVSNDLTNSLEIQTLNDDNQQAEDEKQIQNDEFQVQVDELQQEEDDIKIKNDELQQEKDEYQIQNDELRQEKDEYQIQNDEFKQEEDENQLQNDELQQEKDESQIQNDEFQQEEDDTKIKNDELQQEKDEIQIQNDEYQQEEEENQLQNDEFHLEKDENEAESIYFDNDERQGQEQNTDSEDKNNTSQKLNEEAMQNIKKRCQTAKLRNSSQTKNKIHFCNLPPASKVSRSVTRPQTSTMVTFTKSLQKPTLYDPKLLNYKDRHNFEEKQKKKADARMKDKYYVSSIHSPYKCDLLMLRKKSIKKTRMDLEKRDLQDRRERFISTKNYLRDAREAISHDGKLVKKDYFALPSKSLRILAV